MRPQFAVRVAQAERYSGLPDRNLKNTPEYECADVSPVSSHLWPLSRLVLYQRVSWGELWKLDPELNQLNQWIAIHREVDMKPWRIHKHTSFGRTVCNMTEVNEETWHWHCWRKIQTGSNFTGRTILFSTVDAILCDTNCSSVWGRLDFLLRG